MNKLDLNIERVKNGVIVVDRSSDEDNNWIYDKYIFSDENSLLDWLTRKVYE